MSLVVFQKYQEDKLRERSGEDNCITIFLFMCFLLSGGKDYTAHIREQNVGLCEMLSAFNTCKPPIIRILGMWYCSN